MKIRCNLKYYIGKEEASRYDNYKEYTHFKFQIWSLKQELETKHDYTELIWEENTLLKESELIELNNKEDKLNYFHFNNMSWVYFQKQQNLYLCATDLEI